MNFDSSIGATGKGDVYREFITINRAAVKYTNLLVLPLSMHLALLFDGLTRCVRPQSGDMYVRNRTQLYPRWILCDILPSSLSYICVSFAVLNLQFLLPFRAYQILTISTFLSVFDKISMTVALSWRGFTTNAPISMNSSQQRADARRNEFRRVFLYRALATKFCPSANSSEESNCGVYRRHTYCRYTSVTRETFAQLAQHSCIKLLLYFNGDIMSGDRIEAMLHQFWYAMSLYKR